MRLRKPPPTERSIKGTSFKINPNIKIVDFRALRLALKLLEGGVAGRAVAREAHPLPGGAGGEPEEFPVLTIASEDQGGARNGEYLSDSGMISGWMGEVRWIEKRCVNAP